MAATSDSNYRCLGGKLYQDFSDCYVEAGYVDDSTPEPQTPSDPEPESVKIRFDKGASDANAHGPTLLTVANHSNIGDVVSSVPTVDRRGYEFTGWWFGDVQVYNSSYALVTNIQVGENTTLVAGWNPLPVEDTPVEEVITVTFHLAGGQQHMYASTGDGYVRTFTVSGNSYIATVANGFIESTIIAPDKKTFDYWLGSDGRIYHTGDVVDKNVVEFTAYYYDNPTCSVVLEPCSLTIGNSDGIRATVSVNNPEDETSYSYSYTFDNNPSGNVSIANKVNDTGSGVFSANSATFNEYLTVNGSASGYVDVGVSVVVARGSSVGTNNRVATCTASAIRVGLEECTGPSCGSGGDTPSNPTPGGDTPSDPTPGGDTPSNPTPGGDTPSKITAGCYKCGDKYKYFAAGGTLDSNCGKSPVDGYTKNANDEFCTVDTVPTTPKTKAGCYKCGSVYKYFSAGSTLDSNCGNSPVDGYTKNADNEFCTRPASYSSPATEVPENPDTGTVAIAIAWFAGITALVCSFYYFKKTYFM